MSAIVSAAEASRSRVRLLIVTMLFLVTTVNYADRATLSIAGPALSKELHPDSSHGLRIFGLWLVLCDRADAGRMAARPLRLEIRLHVSIIAWSLFTMLRGRIGFFSGGAAIAVLFALRFLVGFAESPSFPANARVVAAWFPANERGTASAIFNSAQYFATVMFAPIMGWITTSARLAVRLLLHGRVGIIVGDIWLMSSMRRTGTRALRRPNSTTSSAAARWSTWTRRKAWTASIRTRSRSSGTTSGSSSPTA